MNGTVVWFKTQFIRLYLDHQIEEKFPTFSFFCNFFLPLHSVSEHCNFFGNLSSHFKTV